MSPAHAAHVSAEVIPPIRSSARRWPAAPAPQPRFRLVGGATGEADRFGFRHSPAAADAVRAFEDAVLGVAGHKPSVAADLARATAADPGLVAAHALKGFAAVLLARAEMGAPARQALADARSALATGGGGTADEAVLVAALERAVAGRFQDAAVRLDALLDRNPTAFLPAKIAHSLRFMIGDAHGMLAVGARVLDRWSRRTPGYGFLLGCHAFALEELGHLDAAERFGRRAVEIEPQDAWGLHAVSHVHEMRGRRAEGIAWIEGSRPVWSACNNFSFHMAWHLALFRLDGGDHDEVLRIYDEEVRPAATDDFRDVANAVSLLWRLEHEGVAVGRRWDELKAIAERRRHDVTLTFAALHNLLALVATGTTDAAYELHGAMEAAADRGSGDQAEAMGTVGVELAAAILDLSLNRAPRGDLAALAGRLQRIGGSHAQRDVFVQALAGLAARRGDRAALDRILAVRRRLKRDDRFVALAETWLAQAHGTGGAGAHDRWRKAQ
jgi:tetratricopeptide (TPR) repeat protein